MSHHGQPGMRVLAVGVGDALARAAIVRLVADGHQVSVGVDARDALRAVQALGACPVHTPTARQLILAADRCDAVVNVAVPVPPPRGSLARLAHAGARRRHQRLLDRLERALAEINAPRFVQRSSVSLYPDRQSRWIREYCPTAAHRRSRLCARGEQIATTRSAWQDSVVLRFAHPWGGDDPATDAWLLAARNGFDLLDLPADAYWPTIHLGDAARAISAALSAPPGTYNVAETDPQPFAAVTAAVCDAVGRSRLHPLPASLGPVDAGLYLRSHRADSTALNSATGWYPSHQLTTDLRDLAARLQPYGLWQGWTTDVPW